MTDVTASHIAIASWGDTMYHYPVDGDRHYLKYRKDVINNPTMQQKYKADTGKS